MKFKYKFYESTPNDIATRVTIPLEHINSKKVDIEVLRPVRPVRFIDPQLFEAFDEIANTLCRSVTEETKQ
jgi:hypothetical protein